MGSESSEAKWAKAAAAVISEPTLAGAAKKAGISTRTLERFMAEDGFRALLRRARGQLLAAAVNRLLALLPDAGRALKRALARKDGASLKAALGVFDRALKGVEVLDLAGDVESLRAELEELKRGGAA